MVWDRGLSKVWWGKDTRSDGAGRLARVWLLAVNLGSLAASVLNTCACSSPTARILDTCHATTGLEDETESVCAVCASRSFHRMVISTCGVQTLQVVIYVEVDQAVVLNLTLVLADA